MEFDEELVNLYITVEMFEGEDRAAILMRSAEYVDVEGLN